MLARTPVADPPRTAFLQPLLPDGVASADSVGADPDAELLGGEAQLVASAVAKRRLDVANGRTCARRAMIMLGLAPQEILRGPDGQPVWPPGFTGSITHTDGYYAAALARRGRIRSLGIDAEPNRPLPEGVLERIAFGAERELPAQERICWGRLLFSAKESIYKAWYPLTGRWLGFEDVRLAFDAPAGEFRADLLVDGSTTDGRPLSEFTGRFALRESYLLTAVTIG